MHEKIHARGEYFVRVNKGVWERIGNLIAQTSILSRDSDNCHKNPRNVPF